MIAIGKHLIAKAVFKEKAASLILTTTEEKPLYYEVLSVGKQVEEIQVGDQIFVQPYGLQSIEVDGEKLFVVTQESIYAKK